MNALAAMLGTNLGGRYKIIKILAAGGFGQTYLAEDTQRPGHPICVVKQLKNASQNTDFLKVARRLFRSEAETLEKLGRHDQIPQLYAYFEENKEFYLVQEFIEGPSLSEELREYGRLSEPSVLALLQDVLNILAFVHTYQVIHRDIKPSNLLRRSSDSKLVLIDFGAVKEIRTQLHDEVDQTFVTVGIGTQGYVPSEQLAGKPRFSSDLYALGMTAIQALTGLRPHQLPEDPATSQAIWRDKAEVSDGLAKILEKMVRYNPHDRYQSAEEVLQALQQLIEEPLPAAAPQRENWWTRLKQQVWGKHAALIASSGIAGFVIVLRFSGVLQPWELASLDQLFRWRPQEPVDKRVVIVGINEADINKVGQYPIPDSVIANALYKLQAQKPKAIGLDLYRDVPVGSGHEELVKAMTEIPALVGVEYMVDKKGISVPPPPALLDRNQFGFNNQVVDPDGRIRLSLLYGRVDGKIHTSFALRLALMYLEPKGITPKSSSDNPQNLQLGKAVFQRFYSNDGGYVRADAGGYQILTNFRGPTGSFQTVSLTDVLENRVQPNLMRDRIVLIGPTAQTVRDLGYTPYSSAIEVSQAIPGVEIHANYISQIVSAALDERPLIKVWSEPIEWLWILGWSLVGGTLAKRLGSTRFSILGIIITSATLTGTCYVAFLGGWWVPLVPCAIATAASGLLMSRIGTQETSDSLQDSVNPRREHRVTPNNLALHPSSLANQGEASAQLPTSPPPGFPYSPEFLKPNLSSQPLNFDSDSTETTVRGSLEPNQRQLYSLSATKGQLLTVQAVEGDVNVTVIAPDGQTVEPDTVAAQDQVTLTLHWQAMLPEGGEYTIEVYAPHSGNNTVNFDLEIEVRENEELL